MNKVFLSLLSLVITCNVMAQTPKSVGCEVIFISSPLLLKQATTPILDDLWDSASETKVMKEVANSRSGGAIVKMELGLMQAYYVFNTQNGHVEILDQHSGIKTRTDWTQNYKITQTGHIEFVTATLTNVKGNLFGIKDVFQVDVKCDKYTN
jgi:hypothetical protein